MKFSRILTLALALLMALSCFVACDKPQNGTENDNAADDGFANHMTVDIRVFTTVDPKKYTAYEEDSIILGSESFKFGYNEGDTVIATDILKKLAEERGATLTLSTSGGVDSIEFSGEKYTSGSILSDRKGTQTSAGGEKYDVYYYDLVYWEWTCNGQPVPSIKNLAIKDGDKLVLRFVYDNTATDSFKSVEEVDGTGAAN